MSCEIVVIRTLGGCVWAYELLHVGCVKTRCHVHCLYRGISDGGWIIVSRITRNQRSTEYHLESLESVSGTRRSIESRVQTSSSGHGGSRMMVKE